MKFSLNTRISFGITLSTSVALIIIGAMLVKYQVDPGGSLFFLIGIVIAIIGFISLVNSIAKQNNNVSVMDYIFMFSLMVLGILIAVFSEKIQAYGLLVIGICLTILGIVDFASFIRFKSLSQIFIAVIRIVIGVLFIASGFSEAFTSNNEFVARLWEVIGYISIIFGISLIILDSLRGATDL